MLQLLERDVQGGAASPIAAADQTAGSFFSKAKARLRLACKEVKERKLFAELQVPSDPFGSLLSPHEPF